MIGRQWSSTAQGRRSRRRPARGAISRWELRLRARRRRPRPRRTCRCEAHKEPTGVTKAIERAVAAGLVVRELHPKKSESETLSAWCAVFTAGQAVDSGTSPNPAALTRDLRARESDASVRRWCAWLGSELVGAAQARKEGDGSYCRLYVSPAHQRRGAGRALLAALLDGLAEWQVTILRGSVVAGSSGEQFAARLGAQVVVRLTVLEQRIDATLLRRLERLPAPSGPALTVAHWSHSVPEHLIDSFTLARGSILDAPDAELQVHPDHWDVRRVREWEDEVRRRGNELRATAALESTTGAVVGLTEVEVSSCSAASQHDTVVLPNHRGRGVGAWLKAAMTLRLQRDRPDIIYVTSTVNVRNVRMLAVNRRLGYREIRRRSLIRQT